VARYRILNPVEWSKLSEVVPAAYRDRVRALPHMESMATVLLFPHDRRSTVNSAMVANALSKLRAGSRAKIVAVGGCFTLEARRLLDAASAAVVPLSEFPWTDESYQAARRPAR
jgi:hypothetical protein